ncbi:MAG: hypothetical protein JNM13_15215 [Hyphomicrobiaceae bacterium]|nr:hypothetical protein [Hyphomicrobiaceae bacterium]
MLEATVEDVGGLDEATRRRMYALFQRYYDATSEPRFLADLADKHRVVLINDETGRLCGFSTLAIDRLEHQGRPLLVVFSGDTIIDRAHWGSQVFAHAWIREIGRIAATAPDLPLYWLLIVKGHRTYRYLPTFGLTFVPDWRRPDDPALDALKHALASRRFGPAYDPARGIVSFDRSRGHLAAEWAMPGEREARRADVRFFLARNPGYVRGDELVCLAALAPDNMRPLTRRLFEAGRSGQ